jgi:DNA polymerase epsilon subunit 3
LSTSQNDSCFDAFFFVFSAHDVALSKQHKSISASDVLKALEMLEFTDMVEQLQGELQGSYSLFDLYHASYVCTSTVYRQLVKTGEKKLEKKKSSAPVTGPVPSSSRKTIQPSLPDGPVSPEDATLIQQANHEPGYDVPMDVDTTMNEEDQHVDEQDVREDEEVAVEEGISEDDHLVESDGDEPDELEDKVALEEEELRKDHQGLDESPAVVPHEAPTVELHEE